MPPPATLIINPSLEIVDFGPTTLNILSPAGRYSLTDASGLIPELVRSAKAGLEPARFAADQSGRFQPHEIEAAVGALAERRILVPARPERRVDPLLDHIGSASPEPVGRIELVGEGDLAGHVGRVLGELGIDLIRRGGAAPDGEASDRRLILACSDHEDFTAFRAVNAGAVASGRPAYYLSIDRHVVRAGPLVIPHATACLECLFNRVASTRQFHAEFLARSEAGRRLAVPRPSVLALQHAASCLARPLMFLAGQARDLHVSPLHEYDLLKGAAKTSYLLRLPRCPVCGAVKDRPPPEVFQAAIVRRVAHSHVQPG